MDQNNVETVEELIGQDFHIYKAMMPFHVDMNSRMIVAPGIEVKDLMALPIPRKVNIQDLKLKSYEYVANEDYNAIEECDKKAIMENIKVCLTVANKINKSRDASNYDINDEMVNEYTRDPKEDHVLLKVLTEVQKQTVDKNQNLIESEIKEVVLKLLEKPENDVSGDVISQVSKNERLIRSLLDIINENKEGDQSIRNQFD